MKFSALIKWLFDRLMIGTVMGLSYGGLVLVVGLLYYYWLSGFSISFLENKKVIASCLNITFAVGIGVCFSYFIYDLGNNYRVNLKFQQYFAGFLDENAKPVATHIFRSQNGTRQLRTSNHKEMESIKNLLYYTETLNPDNNLVIESYIDGDVSKKKIYGL